MSAEPSRAPTPPSALRGRRTRALCCLVLVGALALAGCSGSDSEKGPDGQSVAKGLTVSGKWPLTGLPAKGEAPKHPVMVVKIDNTASSSPQVGLGKADLVAEELVEGGRTRLAVFYYQRIPKRVGPVRSMRATDIGIVRPAKAVLVAAGGAPPTVKRIKEAGIKVYAEGAPGYERDGGRQAPYNLFMRLTKLAKKTKAKDSVGSYLPFGSKDDLPKGRPAKGLAAQFSGAHTTTWRYQGGRYVDQNSFAAGGDRFRPDSVLVLRVKVGDAGYLDPAGNQVPETKFTGTGRALLFHGGRVVRGTWKKTLDSSISLRTKAGKLVVPAGHTWLELVPAKGGKVTITR